MEIWKYKYVLIWRFSSLQSQDWSIFPILSTINYLHAFQLLPAYIEVFLMLVFQM